MCWTSNKAPIKKIADKNITVIKFFNNIGEVGKNVFLGYFNDFSYCINKETPYIKLNVSGIEIPNVDGTSHKIYNINEGYHSYSIYASFCKGDNLITVLKFNVGNYEKYGMTYTCDKFGLCTIPKGSEYYENEIGEIVSSSIILEKMICPENGKGIFKDFI